MHSSPLGDQARPLGSSKGRNQKRRRNTWKPGPLEGPKGHPARPPPLFRSPWSKPLPTVVFNWGITFCGVSLFLLRIWVNQLQVDDSAVGFSKGTGVNLIIQNGQIGLSGKWTLAGLLG